MFQWFDKKYDLSTPKRFAVYRFKVIHIEPVAAGGDMWDEDNMQTLCEDCHKEKTKEDMKKIRKMRDAKENEDAL